MGKITRQSESSHVTTIVGETGDPEVVDQTAVEDGPRGDAEGQIGNENNPEATEVKVDDADPTEDELREIGVSPDGKVTDEHREQVRLLRERKVAGAAGRATGPEVVEHDTFNPSEQLTEGQIATFEASGEAEVEHGQEPPVHRSIADVQAWVGDDYVKAERALDAEKKNKNRSGLVSWLEKVAQNR